MMRMNHFTIAIVLVFLSCTQAFRAIRIQQSIQFQSSISNVIRTRYHFINRDTGHDANTVARTIEKESRLLMSTSADATIADPPRPLYGLLWLGLIIYAFTLAPGGSEAAGIIDQQLIMKMISTPFDGTSNALFVAIFNFLGIIPAVLAALLLPGSRDQKLPALPFVISSFAVGLFGVGPYLGLRQIRTNVTKSTQGTGTEAFEFKGTAILLLGFGLYLYYYLISQILMPGSGGVEGVLNGYLDLFASQRLVHVSTMDCAILSLAMWDPLREDMARRYTPESPSPIPAWLYCTLPAVGPSLYLLLRPSLPEAK